jgi:hypothetical protein
MEASRSAVVSSDFFKILGLTPVIGRDFTRAEASRPKVPPTAIILVTISGNGDSMAIPASSGRPSASAGTLQRCQWSG